MTNTANLSDIRDFMTRHLQEVFATMLSMELLPAGDFEVDPTAGRVTGMVGIVGEEMDSVLYLHLGEGFALRATAAMLGVEPGEISGEADVNDVVGEITNMVAGGLKSHLNDLGAGCAMSTPGIIRGSSYMVETVPEVTREIFGFECEDARIVVELHIHSKGKLS